MKGISLHPIQFALSRRFLRIAGVIGGSETETVHTTSLLWPLTSAGDNADNMPFDQAKAFRGAQAVTLNTPGL